MIDSALGGSVHTHLLPGNQRYRRDVGRAAQVLLLGAIFLVPYTTFRIVPPFLFTVSDLLFCGALLLMIPGGTLTGAKLGVATVPWYGALVVMLAGFLLGSMINGEPERWIIVAAQYGFAYALLPYLVIQRDRRFMIQAAYALVAGVTLMEAFGAYYYWATGAVYDRDGQISPEFITGTGRLGAFMADANWNASMISMTMPFVFYLAWTKRIRPLVTYGSISILAVGLLLTGSFTGFCATTLGAILFFAIDGGMRAIRLLIGVAALGTSALLLGVQPPPAFQHRVEKAIEAGDINEAGTFTGRLALMREAWKIVDNTSLVGLGVDEYRVVSRAKQPVHNMFLLAWAEGGLIAMIGWLTLTLVPFAVGASALKRDRPAAALCITVASAFMMFANAAPHMYSRSWVIGPLLAIGIVLMPPAPLPMTGRREDDGATPS